MNKNPNFYDMIIIGAGPAGLSAGIYAARAKFKTLLIEKGDIGGQITISSVVVNYPGVIRTDGKKLTEDMRKQAVNFGAEFLNAIVLDVDFKSPVKKIKTSAGDYEALGVILATGANPRTLGFPGEEEFKGHGIAYCATCDGEFFTGMDVFVVGGGYAAAEESVFLTKYAKKVTVLVREPEFTCARGVAEQVQNHPKIDVKFHTEVLETGGDHCLRWLKYQNNETGEITEYHPEGSDETFGIFIFVGYAPASALFQGKVDLDRQGYILTDQNLQTNVPGVFAAGDICVKPLRQVVTAVSDGALCATNLEHYVEERYRALGWKRENTDADAPARPGEASEPGDSRLEQSANPPSESSEGFVDEEMRKSLMGIFAKFSRPVTLTAFLEETGTLSLEIRQLFSDLKGLSDKLSLCLFQKGEKPALEKQAAVTQYPCIALFNHAGEFTGIKFHGVPGGHEFNSFIIALYNTAGPGQPLDEPLLHRIRKVTGPVNIKIAVSLSCTFCPDVVTACQRIALENPSITAEMFDINHFPDFKNKYSIMSVPCIIINDNRTVFGSRSIEEIVELLEKG
ncbi:FAD-dependent oxidoreductase [Diplocloster hominis]|uniref:FAD-dependent oxidoreductase n=1 Tax=Diplocloster hominis TaxID=3079010 RepID=UPI0031BB499F